MSMTIDIAAISLYIAPENIRCSYQTSSKHKRGSINRSFSYPADAKCVSIPADLASSCCSLSSSSSCSTLPTLAYTTSQESCRSCYQSVDEDVVSRLDPITVKPREIVAVIRLQAMVRGTLARWNLIVMRLELRLANIRSLKVKQLKKIDQRASQAKKALKEEYEYKDGHMIVNRRLHRVRKLHSTFNEHKELATKQNKKLRIACKQMAQKNDAAARKLQSFIQMIELAHQNQAMLKNQRQYLEGACLTYETILEELQIVVQDS